MRSYFMAVPVSLLLVAPFAGAQSQAQSQDYPRTDSASVTTVEVTAPPVLVTSDQAESIKGTYEMSNGWHLKAQPVPATRGMIARIDQQPPMRLIALPGDKFITADGNVAMEFRRGAFKDEMVMSYVPASSVADNSAERVTIASR